MLIEQKQGVNCQKGLHNVCFRLDCTCDCHGADKTINVKLANRTPKPAKRRGKQSSRAKHPPILTELLVHNPNLADDRTCSNCVHYIRQCCWHPEMRATVCISGPPYRIGWSAA